MEKATTAAGVSKTIHKETVKLGNREYTFEFRVSAKGNRFFSVTDSHERNGKVDKSSILVFDDQTDAFLESLQRAVQAAKKK
jgi:hypothetical protein